jgi:hypothetical protein
MSVLTKQARDLTQSAPVYLVILAGWIVWSLFLIGLCRHAWGGDSATSLEVLFLFAVAAMTFWSAYYAWLNLYLWLTRNFAGQKRQMLEAEADQHYRPR